MQGAHEADHRSVVGEDVHHARAPADVSVHPLEHRPRPLLGHLVALGVEDLPQGGRDHASLRSTAVLVYVAHEVVRAALPGPAQHPLEGAVEAFVGVGDGEAHPRSALGPAEPEELDPKAPDSTSPAHVATASDLDVLGIDPQVGVAAPRGFALERL